MLTASVLSDGQTGPGSTNMRVSCERQAGLELRSTASVTGSVKTGDQGEGHLVNGQQLLASDWSLLTQF